MLALEKPSRNLEYGVTKSLYTGEWSGEMNVDHNNLFGGSEVGSFVFKRGTVDPVGSYNVKYRNDGFGGSGGHGVEAYSEYIGSSDEGGLMKLFGTTKGGRKRRKTEPEIVPEIVVAETAVVEAAVEETETTEAELEKGGQQASDGQQASPLSLFVRQGSTFRISNPISSRVVRSSALALTAERTLATNDDQDLITSATLSLGPKAVPLPLGAAQSIAASFTGGSRLNEDKEVLPFGAVSVESKEFLPVVTGAEEEGRSPGKRRKKERNRGGEQRRRTEEENRGAEQKEDERRGRQIGAV